MKATIAWTATAIFLVIASVGVATAVSGHAPDFVKNFTVSSLVK